MRLAAQAVVTDARPFHGCYKGCHKVSTKDAMKG